MLLRARRLLNISNDHLCVPVYNVFVNNTYDASVERFIDASAEDLSAWLTTIAGNRNISA